MFSHAITGMLFGLAAGFSPGPLMVLVISETFTRGTAGGIRTAMAPLVTDTPIIILTLLVLNRLSDYQVLFGILSFAGAAFILKMAWTGFHAEKPDIPKPGTTTGSLRKGFFTNILNPHPWIYWISVGSPIIIRASETSLASAGSFILFFYIFILGAKIFTAVMVGKYKHRFDRYYTAIQKALAMLLVLFAFLFVYEGLNYFN